MQQVELGYLFQFIIIQFHSYFIGQAGIGESGIILVDDIFIEQPVHHFKLYPLIRLPRQPLPEMLDTAFLVHVEQIAFIQLLFQQAEYGIIGI